MLKAILCRVLTAVLISVAILLPAQADVKMKTRMTAAGHSFDSTVLIKGARERREMNMGPGFTSVTIYQCDLKRMVVLNPMSKTYSVIDLQDVEDQAAAAAKPGEAQTSRTARPTRGGGVVNVSMTSTPTGEEKKMFGYSARHIKTDVTTDATEGSCSGPHSGTIHMDGWYADIPGYLACSSSGKAAVSMRPQQQGCKDEVHFKGKVSRLGFPLVQETSFTGENGQPMTMRQETLDISTAALDQAMFEIPSDYHEGSGTGVGAGTRSATGAGSAAGQGAAGMSPEQMREMMRQAAANGQISEEQMARAQQAIEMARTARDSRPGSAPAVPQSSGRVRIGIVRMDDHSGQNISTDDLRSRLMENFNEMDAEAVALEVSATDSRETVAQAARGQACDYILYTDLSGKAPSTKKKLGGLIGAGGSATFEGTVKYRLYATNDAAVRLDSLASNNEGSTLDDSLGAVMPKVAEAVMQQVKQDQMTRPHR